MRDLRELDHLRNRDLELYVAGGYGGPRTGAFEFPSRTTGETIRVVASAIDGWDHVSVSLVRRKRTPTWGEMEQVKRLFFRYDETAMQLHVPSSEHLSLHDFCLHLFRPHDVAIPKPPAILVAPPNANDPAVKEAMRKSAGLGYEARMAAMTAAGAFDAPKGAA